MDALGGVSWFWATWADLWMTPSAELHGGIVSIVGCRSGELLAQNRVLVSVVAELCRVLFNEPMVTVFHHIAAIRGHHHNGCGSFDIHSSWPKRS